MNILAVLLYILHVHEREMQATLAKVFFTGPTGCIADKIADTN